MPTYEFRCPNGHLFDKFYRTIGDSMSETPCPECGETAIRQISGGAGLVFKGSGFYLTDYGKNAHRKSGGGGDAKSSETSADSKSGEKPGGGESKGPTESKGPSESKGSSETKSGGETKSSSGGASDAGSSKPSSGDKS
jgi:putative FmdB family regulatory protein